MPQPVEVGLILALTLRGLFIEDFGKMKEIAREAERLGFGSLWHCDHFISLDPNAYGAQSGFGSQAGGEGPPSRPMLEAWTALTALAGATKTIRLGTLVSCVHYRPPALLAKIAASLDAVSGGRVELGLGAGWVGTEYTAFGYPFPKASVRIAMLEEAIQLIRAMWSQPNPAYEGGYYQIAGAVCDPKPLQKPMPPIFTGGEGAKLLGVAARQADGYNCRWWPPERFLERRPILEAECKKAGRDPEKLRASLMVMVIPEKDRAKARAAREKLKVIPETGAIYGPPEECVKRLAAYVKAGVRHLLLTVPDLEEHPERLGLLGEEVLPALKGM
ncbi:MAG: LLM class flavin-dependent oxidoreductase [Candidatus Tectomicrobia bacterium]|uniref:LLM class flavin-dependent oxidoreductase n=1 Tax=Tectimicrobiota bacterium TaxID=2528274 RepID=A0A932I1Z4_UNCTE|nr:LLM class flavin-dependent oxidoreductase [Candidatus Tectomicrobia bacterium]